MKAVSSIVLVVLSGAAAALAGPPVFPGSKVPFPDFERPKQELPKGPLPAADLKKPQGIDPGVKLPPKGPDLIVRSFDIQPSGVIKDGRRELLASVEIRNVGNVATKPLPSIQFSHGLLVVDVLESGDPAAKPGTSLYFPMNGENQFYPLAVGQAKTNPVAGAWGMEVRLKVGIKKCRITYHVDGTTLIAHQVMKDLVDDDKQKHPNGRIPELSETNNAGKARELSFE